MAQHGAEHHAGAVAGALPLLEDVAAGLPCVRAGVRLYGVAELREPLASAGVIGSIAAKYIGAGARPVRALMFDKMPPTNWALGWHQDRTIVISKRLNAPGFDHWTIKSGLQHVEPPFSILDRMITLRVHLDAVPEENAPLLIAPGSHLLGRVAEADIPAAVDRCGTMACLAEAGDVWAYATPILHASAASHGQRRRVLQVDYSASDLPPPLKWRGV
jgi:hypothetical protein